MFDIDYKSFIKKINNFEIKSATFMIVGYSHYNNCTIETYYFENLRGKLIPEIRILPTLDESELVSFYKTFDEDYKIFRMGRGKSYTLKQLWDLKKVVIKEIIYR